jgi:metal-responsive CopG/Arc/MetJ family transcriptional regulator
MSYYIYSMDKEKATRDLSVKVPPSLFDKFSKKCGDNYKTVSEVIRELMANYVRDDA